MIIYYHEQYAIITMKIHKTGYSNNLEYTILEALILKAF